MASSVAGLARCYTNSRDTNRQDEKDIELLVLRHQVKVLQRQ